MEDERLKGIDQRMIELIMNEVSGAHRASHFPSKWGSFFPFQILDRSPKITWDDIAGLEYPKRIITEIVVWPMQRPYVGLSYIFWDCYFCIFFVSGAPIE